MIKTVITILVILIAISVAIFYWLSHRYSAIDKKKSDAFYYNFFKTEVHYVPMGNWFELGDTTLSDLNIKNLEIVNSNYIKDDKVVYSQGDKITNADAASFTAIENKPYFAKDKNTLYYKNFAFENIDLNSFQILDSEDIVKDKNNVYSLTTAKLYGKLPVIKPLPKNYIKLTRNYGKVDTVLYYNETPIVGSSTNGFEELNSYQSPLIYTQSGIYYNEFKLSNIDIASFSTIKNSPFFKDKNGIYYNIEEIYKKEYDKQKGYEVVTIIDYKAKKITIDMATFQVFEGSEYIKDKEGIYFLGKDVKKIKNADLATFHLIKGKIFNLAKDKKNTYLHGEIYTGKIN